MLHRRTLIAAAALAVLPGTLWAQSSYPNKPVRLVVPFAPGGTTDIVARVGLGKDQPRARPDHDYKGFMAELKKNPGKYSYASSGTGGIGHLQMELFKNLSGTFVTHIPYRGAGPALNDTVAGQVPMLFDNLPSALPFIRDGRLIPIVVAAPQRLAVLPNVPTFKEVGLEPVNRPAYYGIYGPKGLPKEVVDKVHDAVKKTLEDPAVKKRIEETGSIIIANTPEQFAAQIAAEFEVYKKVVAAQKLTLE
ncbi:MAG: tripartite tricarboxylate transporter substrate-binding protein [Caldimonas sp.]